MVKKFNSHKKRGSKQLSSPVEPSQGKGQWSKQKPFFTDKDKRVRKVDSSVSMADAKQLHAMRPTRNQKITEKRFNQIVDEYPEKTKGYEIGNFEETVDGYRFHDGMVWFDFKTEKELRAILEDFVQDA